MRCLQLILVLGVVGLLPALGYAQQGLITGTSAPELVQGTEASNSIDPGGGADTVTDGPDAAGENYESDGEPDHISTVDGTLDVVLCGPEDTVVGDPGDLICIQGEDGTPYWRGRYDALLRLQRFMRWMFRLIVGYVQAGKDLGAAVQEQKENCEDARDALLNLPSFAIASLADHFPAQEIHDFELDIEWSSVGFPEWFPMDESVTEWNTSEQLASELFVLYDAATRFLEDLVVD